MVSSTAPISTTRAFARASTVHLSSRLLVQSCQEIWPTASCFSLPSMFCTASCLLVKLGEILVILSDCRLGGVGLGILALFHCLELLDGLRRRSLLLCQTGVIGSAPSSSTSSEIVGGAAVSVAGAPTPSDGEGPLCRRKLVCASLTLWPSMSASRWLR